MIEFMVDLWEYMRERKKFWLAPIIILLLVFSVLIYVASSSSAISPFTYILF